MAEVDTRAFRDLEIQVMDAEVAITTILETPKLRPASIERLVTLDEAITTELSALEGAGKGSGPEADALRQLHKRMLDILRRISGKPQ